MKNKKSFLGLYLIISFVIIIAAVIVSLTAGINLGTDIGGGTQLEVTIADTTAKNKQIEAVKDIVEDYGYRVDKIFVEDKFVDTVIVVRIADKNVEAKSEIRNAIVSELSIQSDDISKFETFNGSITNKAVLWIGVAIVCLLLLLFIAGWIRYKLVAGLSLMFAILHTLMLSVALFVLTRLPITKVSLIEILCGVIFTLFAFVFALEKIKENAALKYNSDLSTIELVEMSKKSTIKPLAFFAITIAVVCLVFVCVPVSFVALSACGLLVCLVSAVYSYYFIGMDFHEKILDIKVQADKAKLSKNSSPAPDKTKAPKRKKGAIKKNKPKKDENDKIVV